MLFSSNRYPSLSVKIESAVEILAPTGKQIVKSRPKIVQFSNGSYITQNIRIIEALLDHPSYNRDFFGPFSVEDVRSGAYKEKLNEFLVKEQADNRTFNVEKIAAEGAANAKNVKVIHHGVNPDPIGSTDPIILKAKDIIERDAAKIKAEQKELEKKNG